MPHNPYKDRLRAKQTRERLLRAGLQALGKQRASEVKVRRVVTDAGVAIGTFYAHFPDADAFYSAVINESLGRLIDQVREARGVFNNSQIADPVANIRDAYSRYFDFIDRNRSEALLLLRQLGESGPYAAMIEEKISLGEKEIAADIASAQKLGLIAPEVDPDLAAEAINAMGIHLGRRYLAMTTDETREPGTSAHSQEERRRLRERLIDTLTQIVLGGILSEQARTALKK